ncbi:hypothetical protein WHI96_25330 [Pseudonocardia tropica]|uniref:Tetratricopeptide repeat protein n=1 Tax=Pseudonocardia tropica TaxID=681289 RepID=A0ABV1K1N4_9PSEU
MGAGSAGDETTTDMLRTATARLLELASPHGADPTVLARRAADRARARGPYHHDTLSAANELALSRLASGHLRHALADLHGLAHTCAHTLGAEHPDTLVVRGNLALAQLAAGELDTAEAALAQLHHDRRRLLGAEHPSTHNAALALALAHHTQHRPDDARALASPIHEHLHHLHGPDHPLTQFSTSLLNWDLVEPTDTAEIG